MRELVSSSLTDSSWCKATLYPILGQKWRGALSRQSSLTDFSHIPCYCPEVTTGLVLSYLADSPFESADARPDWFML
jgi:hypothetical protein